MNAAELSLNAMKMGITEQPGEKDHPMIQMALSRVGLGLDAHDEIAWCSGWATTVHEFLGLPTSQPITLPGGHVVGKAAARSWLRFGVSIPRAEWRPGDVCVFRRGDGNQPGKDVLDAQGHVAFFLKLIEGDSTTGVGPMVECVGGNQSNKITVARIPLVQLLDVRRAAQENPR
jgi:hypothetical protein